MSDPTDTPASTPEMGDLPYDNLQGNLGDRIARLEHELATANEEIRKKDVRINDLAKALAAAERTIEEKERLRRELLVALESGR